MRNLPEVAEADAPARVAAVYEDIRLVLGTTFVNLVYRHLATDLPSLEWAWGAIRPHLASGALAAQATQVREAVAIRCSGWPSDWHNAPAPDLDRGNARMMSRLVAAYNKANATNLMALAHLLRRPHPVVGEPLAVNPALHPGENPAKSAEPIPQAPSADGEMPPLPALDQLTGDDRRRIGRLNRYAESGEPAIVASLYRHLAAWPGALVFAGQVLDPLEQRGLLARGRESTANEAARMAGLHPLAMPLPPAGFESRFGPSLRQLRDVTISKMLPVGHTLAGAIRTLSLD